MCSFRAKQNLHRPHLAPVREPACVARPLERTHEHFTVRPYVRDASLRPACVVERQPNPALPVERRSRVCPLLFPAMTDLRLMTKEELRAALNLPSTRMVDELVRKRKIPVIRLGHRTVRFNLAKVAAALERLELKAVGDK